MVDAQGRWSRRLGEEGRLGCVFRKEQKEGTLVELGWIL